MEPSAPSYVLSTWIGLAAYIALLAAMIGLPVGRRLWRAFRDRGRR